MLKSLFPSGIPVEAYDRLAEILRHLEEARRLAQGSRAGGDTLRQFLRDGTVESDGARITTQHIYEAYVRWCAANAPGVLDQTPSWLDIIRALGQEGVRMEQTTDGWFVVDRRLV